MSEAFAPLRVTNFRRYFVANLIDTSGSMMAPVALAFAVLTVSDSPTALGVVLAANSIPMVLFLLVGGVIADRLPRLLILRVGGVLAGLTQAAAGILVVTDQAELWMLVVLEAANGTLGAMLMPALEGMFPQLVPRHLLQEANVLRSMGRGGLRIIAPTVAAWLVVSVGPGWALIADSATWIVAAALLLRVHLPARERPAQPQRVLTDLREGWTLFTGNTWLWVIVVAFGVLNAIHSGAWFTLGPPHAKDTIGETGWGYLLSAESVGLLLMTLVLISVRLRRPLLLGMLGCAFLGLPLLLFGVTDNLPVLLAAAFAGGAGIEVFSLGWSLAMQENIPEDKLSRAYSYDALGSYVAIPVGQLAYGPLGERFGFRDVLLVSGVAYIAVSLLTLLSRSVREMDRPPPPEE